MPGHLGMPKSSHEGPYNIEAGRSELEKVDNKAKRDLKILLFWL